LAVPVNFFPVRFHSDSTTRASRTSRPPYRLQQCALMRAHRSQSRWVLRDRLEHYIFFHFHLLFMYTTFSIGTSCVVKNNEYADPPHLRPSTPTFRCTCCARRHRSSSSTSVRERLASANALAISGKRCEPGFPDAEPFYTYTAPPRIFFGLTILILRPSGHTWTCKVA
jgi:hypothetical protein